MGGKRQSSVAVRPGRGRRSSAAVVVVFALGATLALSACNPIVGSVETVPGGPGYNVAMTSAWTHSSSQVASVEFRVVAADAPNVWVQQATDSDLDNEWVLAVTGSSSLGWIEFDDYLQLSTIFRFRTDADPGTIKYEWRAVKENGEPRQRLHVDSIGGGGLRPADLPAGAQISVAPTFRASISSSATCPGSTSPTPTSQPCRRWVRWSAKSTSRARTSLTPTSKTHWVRGRHTTLHRNAREHGLRDRGRQLPRRRSAGQGHERVLHRSRLHRSGLHRSRSHRIQPHVGYRPQLNDRTSDSQARMGATRRKPARPSRLTFVVRASTGPT